MSAMFRRNSKWLVGLLIVFGLGLIVGRFVRIRASSDWPAVRPVTSTDTSYKFIAPLIGFEIERREFYEFRPLKKELGDLIQKDIDSGKVHKVSIYFRDPTNGQWFGVNEDQGYNPASLLKVPAMIAYFKEAESNPAALSTPITYTGASGNQAIASLEPMQVLKSGKTYSADELIRAMIVQSDNTSFYLLLGAMDQNSLRAVFSDLGIQFPRSGGNEYLISPKTYLSFFRILYRATFLNREMSEKALTLLSQTEFGSGLVTGLPPGMNVAHKYGEWAIRNGSGAITGIELHDCGIVYAPNHPYQICIMTEGTNEKDLETTIQGVSKAVHAFVTR